MPIKCCGLFGSQKKPGKEKRIFKKDAELPVRVERLHVDHWKEIVEREEGRDDNYDRANAAHVDCAFHPEAIVTNKFQLKCLK